MQRAVALLTLVIALSLAGLAQTGKTGDTGEFKGLIQHYWEAWSTLNPDNAAPMYAKDADAVFFDIAPLKYNGWNEYKEGVKKVLGDVTSATFIPNDDLKATRRGNIAWTSVTVHAVMHQKDGKTTDTNIRHTVIWEKRGGKWTIVHEHVSAPLGG